MSHTNPAEENPWITHTAELMYENPWIQITEYQVTNPSGKPGMYGVVSFKNYAVGVIPLDSDGYTWLVGQYRYPLGIYSWEIPAGGCPQHEALIETAKRELSEETGLIAQHYDQILFMHLSNSITNEEAYIFLATDIQFGTAQPEETEQLQVKKVHFSQALQMVLEGSITDSLSVAGILKTQLLLQQGYQKHQKNNY
ncbi:MAG: NUDIX hydrolase [Bacteroidia bacterium]|nr:NUDIX hydrolase [Bacteroidia bacterium]